MEGSEISKPPNTSERGILVSRRNILDLLRSRSFTNTLLVADQKAPYEETMFVVSCVEKERDGKVIYHIGSVTKGNSVNVQSDGEVIHKSKSLISPTALSATFIETHYHRFSDGENKTIIPSDGDLIIFIQDMEERSLAPSRENLYVPDTHFLAIAAHRKNEVSVLLIEAPKKPLGESQIDEYFKNAQSKWNVTQEEIGKELESIGLKNYLLEFKCKDSSKKELVLDEKSAQSFLNIKGNIAVTLKKDPLLKG